MGVFLKRGNYWIDYYAYGRRKREQCGPSKRLAQNALRKRKVEIVEGKFFDIRREQRIKFKDFAEEYLENHAKVNKRSWRSTDVGLIRNLVGFFGEKYLHEITPLMVERYKAQRIKEVSKATTNRSLSCLRCVFNRSIAWGKQSENPVKKIKFYKENNERVRFLEKDEITRLLSNCSPRLRSIVVLALHTGLRKNELAFLKWRDVDIERDVITIHKTKSGETRRIPLNRISKQAIVCMKKHSSSEFIFYKKDGTPFNCRKAFASALRKSGISDFRYHDLRHCFGSYMAMAGVDINTIREIMGHKDIKLTLRYAHLSPEHKARAVDVLERKMDTIWTPGQKQQDGENLDIDVSLDRSDTYPSNAHVAQLVEQRFRKP